LLGLALETLRGDREAGYAELVCARSVLPARGPKRTERAAYSRLWLAMDSAGGESPDSRVIASVLRSDDVGDSEHRIQDHFACGAGAGVGVGDGCRGAIPATRVGVASSGSQSDYEHTDCLAIFYGYLIDIRPAPINISAGWEVYAGVALVVASRKGNSQGI